MSDENCRIFLRVLLSVFCVAGSFTWAMTAWPDSNVLAPKQAIFVLASIALWSLVGIRVIYRALGSSGERGK